MQNGQRFRWNRNLASISGDKRPEKEKSGLFFLLFRDLHEDDIVADLADAVPRDYKILAVAEKSAEFHGGRKNETGKMSCFGMKFHIDRTAKRFAGTDIDDFLLAEIYNAHTVLLFTDSYEKTYAKMLPQLT